MSAIVVALIAGAFSLFAAVYSGRANARIAGLVRDLRAARRELEECRTDRRHLRAVVQAVVSAIIGQLTTHERTALLSTVYDDASENGGS